MDWFVKAFIKASVSWLAAGALIGTAMAVHPVWTVYRPAHVHIMLLGFVTMMIYGVAYHVIPRFAGHPLAGRRAVAVHVWIANIGLALMVAGFVLRANGAALGTPLLSAGGTLAGIGAYIFAVVVWRTIDGPARMRKLRESAARSNAPGPPKTSTEVSAASPGRRLPLAGD